jgi:hypothetical protein
MLWGASWIFLNTPHFSRTGFAIRMPREFPMRTSSTFTANEALVLTL